MVQAKRFETTIAGTVFDQHKVPCSLHGGQGQTRLNPQVVRRIKHGTPHHQIRRIKTHDGAHIPSTQSDGRCLHANFQIVITIDHGVLGVVSQDPKQISDQQ